MRRTSLFLLVLAACSLDAAVWRSGGPAGGVARMLAAAPSNPQILYLASNGGVFRSADGGATWRNVSGPITSSQVIAVDPRDPNTLYAALGADHTPVYKSTDGGSTWTELDLPLVRATAILIDPRDSDVVFIASGCGPIFSRGPRADFHEVSGVFKSTDGGVTFHNSSVGLQGFTRCVMALTFDPHDPDTLYASPIYGDSGFARSDDAGQTWTAAKVAQPGREAVADPRNPNRLYGVGQGQFLSSDDAGATWSVHAPRLLDGGSFPRFVVTDVDVDAVTGRLFVATGEGAFRSGDGGASFLSLGGTAREPIYTMLFDSATGTLTIGTPTGVYQSRSFPWNEWTALPTGDISLEMRHVVPSLVDPATAYASSRGRVYVTRDAGLSWARFGDLPVGNLRDAFVTALVADAGETLYARVYGNGSTWTYKLPPGSTEWMLIEGLDSGVGKLAVDPRVPGVVYVATTGGFLVSRDGGSTWNRIFLPNSWSGYTLTVDPDESNVLFAATSVGLMKSRDGGHTWELKLPGANLELPPTVSPADGGATLYADIREGESGAGLYRSTDRGESWTRVSTLPLGTGVFSMVADPRDARTLYVTSLRAGVFRSTDGGETFHSLAPPTVMGALAINQDGTILHATSSRGMWELSLTGRRRAVR